MSEQTKPTEKKVPTSYASATIKPLEKSRVEIVGSITPEVWQKYRSEALKHINEHVTIDGFRKGMVPENVLIAKVGDIAVLEEMAEHAMSKAYIEIIIDNKIDAIGKPEIQVTKLAKDNPLEFRIVTAVVPEVKLPDYKKLAQKEVAKQNPDDVKVTEKDLEDTIVRIRKSRASHEGHDHATMTPEEHEKAVEASLPDLTDDFVKTLGDFADVPDFKNKLSTMVAEEKRQTAIEKTRIHIADAIADGSKIDLPEIMLESELHRTESQFNADMERMGVKLEDYLKHAKKTIDEIRAEWRPHAEKKAKLQLILNAIAQKENIRPDAAEVEAEVNHIVEHYKEADREHATAYAETVLTNEKVFQFLESPK
jgi:FKBP-type peptidyl-prolyl cis-trans isomerase (trigger factor)